MKKKISLALALIMAIILSVASFYIARLTAPFYSSKNFSQEMKFETRNSLNDSGADIFDRYGDHIDSPYFYSADIYNMEPTDTRFILPQFKTMNQTSWWSCGEASILMVLEHFNKRGDWDEGSLAALIEDHSDKHIGTCLDQMIAMLEGVGEFSLVTSYDYADKLEEINMSFFCEQIKQGFPVIIGWNDWGGHWEVVIGYDTMGTEHEGDDVLIIADPFDTCDHNQDGYGILSAERFISNFSFYTFFPEDHQTEKCFIVVKPLQ